MSMWVHVAAVVRIDSFGPVPDERVIDIFGKQCLYGDDSKVWDHMRKFPEQYLPMGSEGSLKMSVWHNPDESAMPSTTVTIFGDLRDRDNADYLIKWFKEKCNLCDKILIVRQAVITIDPEFLEPVTYRYDRPDRIYEKKNNEEAEEL